MARCKPSKMMPHCGPEALVALFRMPQHIGYIALLVRDYDEAMSYFVEKLGFKDGVASARL